VLAKTGPAANDAPVILVASESPQTFTTGYTDPFSQRFAAPFVDECMLHGISLRPALLAGTREETPGIPVGVNEARDAIRRLGSRYQGTLVLSAFPRESGVDRWVEAINRFGKPVVFFDHTDKGGFLTRKGLSTRKGFFRLHLDDRNGVQLALRELHAAGHTTTVGVHGGELYDWSRKRMELIRECAKEFTPALTIAEAGPVEPVWKMYERKFRYASIVTLIQGRMRGHHNQNGAAAGMRQELLRATPSLAKLLSEQHPTALIVMNDEIARDYVFWLQAAGIDIPRDLSLIAFDNTPTNLLVSSVDWGFSRLGYLAAHIFIHDVPLHADRDGNIPGICSLVDRGSMGAPALISRTPAPRPPW
jgi:DNA-binding LacI/PurR family transcriptional regulator